MRRQLVILSMLVAAATLISFAPVFSAGITNWDDPVYLQSASAPLSKLITAPVLGHHHPLTMLSLAIEERLFGIRAGELHATNVLLHVAASVVVLMLLVEMTGSPFGALAGALFFAIHPLRVESVAWIAERKDVLCELFFAAALLAYVRNIRRGKHFGWVFAFFVLALLAKATAVVFPIAMLLIDFLERQRPRIVRTAAVLATSLTFGVIAILGQRGPGALTTLPGFTFSPLEKVLLACRVVVMYLAREIVPANLSAFYPYPRSVGVVDALCAAGVLALVIAVGAAAFRWRPLVFGFTFFLLAIAPTLPVLSIGRTMLADRLTLLPSIGLAYLVAAGGARMRASTFAIATVIAVGILLGVATWQRCAVWHDSISLWTSVIDYDDSIPLAYNSRAVALIAAGDAGAAKNDLDRAVALDRCSAAALRNRALLAGRAGDFAAADRDLQAAIACDPLDAQAREMRRSLLMHTRTPRPAPQQ